MTAWPDTDGRIVERYVAQRRLRCPTTPIYYRQALHSFRKVVFRRQKTDRKALEIWLNEGDRVWARSTVLHRAQIVNRFLDFLLREGWIESNPIADLRSEYHASSDIAILRALLACDPDHALEKLRRVPPFGSVLGKLMRDHIALMHARGYRYQTQAALCRRFDYFLQAHPELADEPVDVMLRHWQAARSTANHAADCEKMARILNKILRHLDPSIKPRPSDPRPVQQVARQWRRPYIYSPEEIRHLLDIARRYPSPRAPSRPINLYTMIVLAYCAGLRLGELARLTLADVDLKLGAITIRETKFFKSRVLPLSGSALSALEELLEARRRAKAPDAPEAGLFWHDQGDRRYTPNAIARNLVSVLRCAGIKPAKGKIGPRIHDLRHSFVVNRMREWYRAGVNPQDKLPFLATYLGHRDINSTLVYITVTRDLLEQASERFRAFGAHCLSAPKEARP